MTAYDDYLDSTFFTLSVRDLNNLVAGTCGRCGLNWGRVRRPEPDDWACPRCTWPNPVPSCDAHHFEES